MGWWDTLRKWFSRRGAAPGAATHPHRVRPAADPGEQPRWLDEPHFGVRVLDVRPITQTMLSMTRDRQCAANAVSYGGETGASFASAEVSSRRVEGTLTFHAPRHGLDGALFIPTVMEEKWALFVVDRTLLVVRSWLRTVVLKAPVVEEGGLVVIGPFSGHLVDPEESAEETTTGLDFVLRTHALGEPWPVPLTPSAADMPPAEIAMAMMRTFGRKALFASLERPDRTLPETPLRAVNALHFAVVKNDVEQAAQLLARGTPPDVDEHGGSAPLHLLRPGGEAMLDLLLRHGANIDVVNDDGATPLMLAVQRRDTALVRRLLGAGADARAVDLRGFSAMHRAAEMNEAECARLLLDAGADPDVEASTGHTARALAQARNADGVLRVLASVRLT